MIVSLHIESLGVFPYTAGMVCGIKVVVLVTALHKGSNVMFSFDLGDLPSCQLKQLDNCCNNTIPYLIQ